MALETSVDKALHCYSGREARTSLYCLFHPTNLYFRVGPLASGIHVFIGVGQAAAIYPVLFT